MPAGTTLPTSRARAIVLRSGPPPDAEWVTETVNVRRDYERLYGEAPGRARGVAVLTDADQTRSRAVGDYGSFRVCPERPVATAGPDPGRGQVAPSSASGWSLREATRRSSLPPGDRGPPESPDARSTTGRQEDSAMELGPVTLLRGRHVTLEPLDERHAPGLFDAMRDEEVCRYLAWPPPADPRRDPRPHPRRAGADGPRPVCRLRSGLERDRPTIGSTRFLDIRPKDRQVEIGSTFLARAYWRTPANTEAKYLLLRHCFESLGCVRVALKTDGRNTRSQTAIERLGAVREGVLRKHMNVRGYQRDTVYYSILEDEWPAVKARLEARLGQAAAER